MIITIYANQHANPETVAADPSAVLDMYLLTELENACSDVGDGGWLDLRIHIVQLSQLQQNTLLQYWLAIMVTPTVRLELDEGASLRAIYGRFRIHVMPGENRDGALVGTVVVYDDDDDDDDDDDEAGEVVAEVLTTGGLQ